MERLREDILDLGAGRRPRADRRRDRHRQDAGRPCAARRRTARGQEVRPCCPARRLPTTCSARRLFGPMEEGGQIPLLEEARGGTLVLEDIEALQPAAAGAASDLHQRSGHAGRNPHHRDLQLTTNRARTVEDALRPDLYYRLGRAEDHAAAAAGARRGYPDAVHAPGRAVRRGIRLRRAAGHGAGGGATVAGALAGQRAPADQRRRTRGAAEPARDRVDRVAADGG